MRNVSDLVSDSGVLDLSQVAGKPAKLPKCKFLYGAHPCAYVVARCILIDKKPSHFYDIIGVFRVKEIAAAYKASLRDNMVRIVEIENGRFGH